MPLSYCYRRSDSPKKLAVTPAIVLVYLSVYLLLDLGFVCFIPGRYYVYLWPILYGLYRYPTSYEV